MKVGDFVRFKSAIVRDNGHLALANDRGVVVSMDGQKTAVVVWDDGEKGTHRVSNLVRTVGVIGHAARSPGEKRTPIKDRGHKPVAVPARPVHTSRETGAIWFIADEHEIKGFVGENEVTGKYEYKRYKIPPVGMDVRAHGWPVEANPYRFMRRGITLSVTFPNGEKKSMTPTGARVWIMQTFGPEMGATLVNRLRVQDVTRKVNLGIGNVSANRLSK